MALARIERSFEDSVIKRDERIAQQVVARLLPYLSSPNGNSRSRLIDTRIAAGYLGISQSALRKLKSRGYIPFVQINRRVMYDRVVLDKWIVRKRVKR
jgi:hypothetical protein